jgi:D-glycero-alpha-D-manno-heptose-7-phosphate kinase
MVSKSKIIRSKAPLRISFGGGGTDVSPYPEEQGGAVLSATIDKYTYCTLIERDDDTVRVRSLDYETLVRYNVNSELQYDGKLDLVKAVTKVTGIRKGCELLLHSDAPPGSGLGSSSALVVGLVGAIKHWLRLPLTHYEIADLAYRIEREELGIKGGKQDQYAATFGAFNFIEFLGDKTIVNPLRIDQDIINELEYRLILCYTGETRLSAGIIEDQVGSYVQRKQDVVKALDETKSLAVKMKNALLLGQLDEFGSLMHQAWDNKRRFSSKVTNPHIDQLYEAAKQGGAIGGKLLGAGGGGYLLLFCEFDRKHTVAERLARLGGQIADFSFDFSGLQTWEVGER